MIIINLYLTFSILLYYFDKYDINEYCLWIFPFSNLDYRVGNKRVGAVSHILDVLLHLSLILFYLDFIGVVNIVIKIS